MTEEVTIEKTSFEMIIEALTKVESYIWVFIILTVICGVLLGLGYLSGTEFISTLSGSALISILLKLLKEKKVTNENS